MKTYSESQLLKVGRVVVENNISRVALAFEAHLMDGKPVFVLLDQPTPSELASVAPRLAQAREKMALQMAIDDAETAGKPSLAQTLRDVLKRQGATGERNLQEERGEEPWRSKARDWYGGDNCNVDSDALVSVGDDGAWVQAWVFVEKPE